MKKETTKTEIKYYSLNSILRKNADYNIVFGERSNGKTYAALAYAIEQFLKTGKQSAYIRRWQADLYAKRAESLFNNHCANGYLENVSNGLYNTVIYSQRKWYLAKYDNETGKAAASETPFCYAFCLSEQEHDKSTSFPNIDNIIFDEFLTRRYYLPEEFMLFMNVLSTIIRDRNGVKIFMLGNTVNKYCPYFAEMGLRNIGNQKQGTIDIYSFGENGCKIAVEYAATTNTKKVSNKYFCFDNEKLQMITNGKWELSIYPHCPQKYTPKDIIFIFYILWNDTILQGNVINTGNNDFIFIHQKTTEIKDLENSLIYCLEPNSRPNYRRRLISNITDIDRKITNYFAREKVFYQSNEIGEIVRNYVQISSKNNIQ